MQLLELASCRGVAITSLDSPHLLTRFFSTLSLLFHDSSSSRTKRRLLLLLLLYLFRCCSLFRLLAKDAWQLFKIFVQFV